jgi:CubicO group peptidase (beta-lactamase class C family)
MNPSIDLQNEIDGFVNKAMQTWNVPGLALVIVRDDQVMHMKGYGVRDMNRPEPVDEHTLFSIASNTKAFTATAMGLLVQDGRVNWDDPVKKHLPTFKLHDPHATELITIRDLLCHRAGLGTWEGDLLLSSAYPAEDIIRRLQYIPPAYGFRAGYGYSNLMFITAGLVIETVSGMSWDDFILQRIFEPLGLKDSVTGLRYLGDRANIARPHEDIKGNLQLVRPSDDGSHGAAGAINASIADIALWLRMQLNAGSLDGKQIVDPRIINETHAPHTNIPLTAVEKKLFPSRHFSAYGLGWFLNDNHGRLAIRHTGGLNGMLSVTMLIPEEKIGIAVFTNKLPNYAYLAIPSFITELLLGLTPQDWIQNYKDLEQEEKLRAEQAKLSREDSRPRGTRPSLALEKYAGNYESAILGEATVSVDGDGFHIQLLAHESICGTLEHSHYDTFVCHWDDPVLGDSLIPFITDGQGNVVEFHVKIREDWIDPLEHVFGKTHTK